MKTLTDEQMAIELYVIAHTKGYETHVYGNVVTFVNHSDLNLTVEVIGGKYIVNRSDKDNVYVSVSTAIKGIARAFEKNKQKVSE